MHMKRRLTKYTRMKLETVDLYWLAGRNTYIHYNPFSRTYNLASHTTYVVCVNFILDRVDRFISIRFAGDFCPGV